MKKLLSVLLMFFILLQAVPVYALEGQNNGESLDQYISQVKGEKTTKEFILEQLKMVRDSLQTAVKETEGFKPVEDIDNSSQGLVESLNNLSEILVVFLDILIKVIE